jgi:hypothetical protein
MNFRFPDRSAVKIATITLPFSLWSELQEICHERSVTLSQAIVIPLEPTIAEYHKQYHPGKIAREALLDSIELDNFPMLPELPAADQPGIKALITNDNPQEKKQPEPSSSAQDGTTPSGTKTPVVSKRSPLSAEESIEQKKKQRLAYMRQYYQQNREKIVAHQREVQPH